MPLEPGSHPMSTNGRVGTDALRGFTRAKTLAAIASIVVAVWLLFRIGGPYTTRAVDDGATAVAAFVAALASTRAARRRDSLKLFWARLACACWAWTAAEVAWAVLELGLGDTAPFPSFADIGYVAAVPLAAAALLAFPALQRERTAQARAILDGLIAGGSLLLVSWEVLLGPIYRSAQTTTLEKALSLFYPLGDVLIITLALLAFIRVRHRDGAALAYVLAGLVAMALADSVYAYLTQVNSYGTGSLIDDVWIVAYLLLALGAIHPSRPGQLATKREPPSSFSIIAPYVPFALIVPVVLAAGLVRRGTDQGALLIGAPLVAIVGLRQVAALFDNAALSRSLERKVADRTSEIQRQREHFRSLVQNSSDLVLVVDRDGAVRDAGGSGERAFGGGAEHLIGSAIS